MLEKYREEEGAEDIDDGAAASGGGGGGGESYERLPAAQKCLLKFQETIALAPEQLVRCVRSWLLVHVTCYGMRIL